jgi:hypothetical protein
LFTFGPTFSNFNRSLFVFPKQRKEDFHDVDGSDSEEEYYDENDHDDSDHDEESDEDTSYDTTRNKDVPSFLEALRILSHPDYHLVDAYPTDPHFASKVYAIAVAILISSATAECSSSAIKRVNTGIARTVGSLLLLLLSWEFYNLWTKSALLTCLQRRQWNYQKHFCKLTFFTNQTLSFPYS